MKLENTDKTSRPIPEGNKAYNLRLSKLIKREQSYDWGREDAVSFISVNLLSIFFLFLSPRETIGKTSKPCLGYYSLITASKMLS